MRFLLLLLFSSPALAMCNCYFSYVSPTQVVLSMRDGNRITINGVDQTLPPSGIPGSNSGLQPDTTYNVFAVDTAALVFSTDGHEQNQNGIEVRTGNSAYSLVGKVHTDSSGQFVPWLWTISWFNRIPRSANNHFTQPRETSYGSNPADNTYVELDPEIRTHFLTWGDGVTISASGAFGNDTAGRTSRTAVGLDGNTPIPDVRSGMSTISYTGGGAFAPLSLSFMPLQNPTEGFHYVTLLGNVSEEGPSTGIWSGRWPIGLYCTLAVTILG